MSTPGRAFAHRLADRPSLTAEAVTLSRAIEHLRPAAERIVDDPYAQHFLGRPGRAALAAARVNGPATRILRRLDPGGMTFIACRHRYLDDQLVAALHRGAEQVVLLGAGYDSRAYRFATQLDGRPVFEVDLAAISRKKARTVAAAKGTFPETNVRRVEIDFETQTLAQALTAAGFRTGAPTFVVWEGVCMYLTREAVKGTITAVAELTGPGSVLGMDAWYLVDDPSPRGTLTRSAPSMLSLIGEAVTFGIHPEDMPGFLDRLGFGVVDVALATDLEHRYSGTDRPVAESVYLLAAARR